MIQTPSSAVQPLALVEPDAASWDAFVAAHPHGHMLQQSAWGQLKASAGWRVVRVAVQGTENRACPERSRGEPGTENQVLDSSLIAHRSSLLSGAQLLVRQRYGVSVVYAPRGPLFSGDEAVDGLLLQGLERVARRRRAVFLRLEPNRLEGDAETDALHTGLLLQNFQVVETIQPRSSVHVSLAPPPEQLFASFSKGHRADIRRAERQGVTVRVGGADELGPFYAIMQATGARAAFGIHSEEYYRQAWALFQPRSRLLLAEHGGEVVAAHMVFADSQRGLYLYSGATDVGLKTGANHLLEWHAMQWAQASGCTSYDLWGIPDALGRASFASDEATRAALEAEAQADPLIGVYRFKKGFGGHVVRYLPAYDRVLLPPLYALWRRRVGV
ncbi:MAG: peptidoglycan bridge formation glycyltransferase FemA/FemB family protein [Chloroflexaceae bacterium]|jgi:lipid II:glycine glycyltransferase (peptidoglycan interpeptide bridge formation enzyme)|nr:peptidoglycan bridge formation glycyltransferase FemA/FemB family protein [Chloroflexaceae bacterium]